MEQYLNREYKDIIKSFQMKSGRTKEGTEYTYLSILLINGYEHRIFLRGAEQFAFVSAFEQLSTTKQIEMDQTTKAPF